MASITAPRIRAIRDGMSVAGLICLVYFWRTGWPNPGFDVFAYWAVDPWSPYDYDGDPHQFGAFRYSPAAAQALGLINWLPWPAFFALWMVGLFAALIWIGRWWSVALLIYPPVLVSLWYGNIEVLLAAAIVAGFRWPAAWAFVFLTKLTPGVGVLWFAFRREWRNLAIAILTTAAVAATSFALAPGLWLEWPRELAMIRMSSDVQPVPLTVRLSLAVILIAWGARTDRSWAVVVAAAVATPLFSSRALAVLIGVAPLLLEREHRATGPVRADVGHGAVTWLSSLLRRRARASTHASDDPYL